MNIEAATLKYYNANNRGNRTRDCVKRALSLALDISYTDISKLLNAEMHRQHTDAWNYPNVYGKVAKELGCSDWIYDGVVNENGRMKLDEFVDTVLDPNQTYLVHTGRSASVRDHIVCVRDGKIWDSWDSRDSYVFSYAIAPTNKKHIASSDLNYVTIANKHAVPAVAKAMERFIKKRQWEYTFLQVEPTRAGSYHIVIRAQLTLAPTSWIAKKRAYTFDISFTIEPTMDEEEAIQLIGEVAKVRGYDRMYAIAEQEKKLKEAEEIKRAAGEEGTSKAHLFLDGRESRFYNSLPGWVKPLVTNLSIYEPHQYSNSYSIRIKPLPNDTEHSKRIEFEAYDSASLKDMLQRYRETGEVPWEDYSPSEEY